MPVVPNLCLQRHCVSLNTFWCLFPYINFCGQCAIKNIMHCIYWSTTVVCELKQSGVRVLALNWLIAQCSVTTPTSIMIWDKSMVYFKYETKQFMFQMLITFATRPHRVRYWLIYTVKIRCLSSLVDIYIRLFNQKWLGTPALASGYLEPPFAI